VPGGAGAAQGGIGASTLALGLLVHPDDGAVEGVFGPHCSLSSTARHPASGGPYHCSAVRQACSAWGDAKSFRRLQGPPFDTHINHRAFCS
jgi:hypothetical protein